MKKAVVAVVGGETLLGRELRDVLSGAARSAEIRALGTVEDVTGILAEDGGEATVIPALKQELLKDTTVAVLAGAPATSRKVVEWIGGGAHPAAVVDCTYSLEENPTAKLRAPLAEPGPSIWPDGTVHVIAHPAAAAIAILLKQLRQSFEIRQSLVHIFEPASERGQAGIDELQKQTVSLLSFRTLPKEIYDTQVAFNLLPHYGEEARESVEKIQERIERHLASLLAALPGIPMPSLRLIPAPVFHGYTFSVWVEFATAPNMGELTELLDTPLIEVRGADVEAPSNVGVAGESGLSAGAIQVDGNNPRAVWFWIAADNLRLHAENAAIVVRTELATASGGVV